MTACNSPTWCMRSGRTQRTTSRRCAVACQVTCRVACFKLRALHSLRRPVNCRTCAPQGWRILDFLSHHPESCHILTWLLDEPGLPANWIALEGAQTCALWQAVRVISKILNMA